MHKRVRSKDILQRMVTIDGSVSVAWEEVLDDHCDTAWISVCYLGNDFLTIKNKGAGGRRECFDSIVNDKDILFGGFRLTAIDGRGSTASKRAKFVFFMYRAPAAQITLKARAGEDMAQIESYFIGYHVKITMDNLSECSEAEIVRKLRAIGGAHQPTGFDFGYGNVGEGSEETSPVSAPVVVMNSGVTVPDVVRAPREVVSASAVPPPQSFRTSGAPQTAAATAVESSCPDSREEADQVLVLVTGMPSSTVCEAHQSMIRTILQGRRVEHREVDGVDMANRDKRNMLFGVSGKRGVYPQVFIQEAGSITFVGDFEEMQSLNDADTLPDDLLRDNPGIPTLARVFGKFMR